MSDPNGLALRLPAPIKKGFPQKRLSKGKLVARSHKVGQHPWWFSSAPDEGLAGGRFDLRSPNGTCYVADTSEVATRERLRGTILAARIVTPSFADAFAVSHFRVPKQYTCANIDASKAADLGVTRELAALTAMHYSVSRAWASAFADAAFDGIRYGARFSPGEANAWALFGSGGNGDPPISSEIKLITGREACRLIDVTVSPHPRLEDLEILDNK